jgi:hypothetical protein
MTALVMKLLGLIQQGLDFLGLTRGQVNFC